MISPDHDLIQACLSGDQNAWTELIGRYQRLIYSVARRICPQPDDASDVFQHVCLQLHRNLQGVRDERTLAAWLMTVTRRRALAVLRAQKTSIPIEDFDAAIEGQIENIEKEWELEQVILQLPDRCRKLLGLLYFSIEEPSYVDIGIAMEMPAASVGPTRARCLEKLKKLLDE